MDFWVFIYQLQYANMFCDSQVGSVFIMIKQDHRVKQIRPVRGFKFANPKGPWKQWNCISASWNLSHTLLSILCLQYFSTFPHTAKTQLILSLSLSVSCSFTQGSEHYHKIQGNISVHGSSQPKCRINLEQVQQLEWTRFKGFLVRSKNFFFNYFEIVHFEIM